MDGLRFLRLDIACVQYCVKKNSLENNTHHPSTSFPSSIIEIVLTVDTQILFLGCLLRVIFAII